MGWSYVASDESNHGNNPEIVVVTLSSEPGDAIVYPVPTFRKKEGRKRFEEGIGSMRDYRFIIHLNSEQGSLERPQIFGAVLASLLADEQITARDKDAPIQFFFDGVFTPEKREYSERAIELATGLFRAKIELHCGKDFDRRVELVNYADRIAYGLFRRPLNKLSDHPKRKILRQDLLEKLLEGK